MMSIYGIGIKDVVLLLAGITCVYLAYMWLRLMQMKRKKQKRVVRDRLEEPRAAAPKVDIIDDTQDDDDHEVVYAKPRKQIVDPIRSAPENTVEARPPGFDRMISDSQQRLVQSQARELQQLKDEVRVLQQQQTEMREEIDRLKAARNVSPLYNEAVSMAQHGLNAEGIASRCGISIAEAELVAALASKSESTAAEDYDEDYHGKAAA